MLPAGDYCLIRNHAAAVAGDDFAVAAADLLTNNSQHGYCRAAPSAVLVAAVLAEVVLAAEDGKASNTASCCPALVADLVAAAYLLGGCALCMLQLILSRPSSPSVVARP